MSRRLSKNFIVQSIGEDLFDLYVQSKAKNRCSMPIFAAVKNQKGIALLLSAHVVSSFAQGITMFSIPWYFTSVVDEAEVFGQVLAGATFASIFWSLFAGTLIDRYSRKNIFLITSIIGFFVLGAAGWYGHTYGETPMWLVAAIFVFTFFGFNIHYPNLYAFTQQMAAKGQYGKVNSIIEVLGQSTNVLSGAFGAILLSGTDGGPLDFLGLQVDFPIAMARWEIHEIFLLDATTYVLAACIIPFISYISTDDLPVDMEPIMSRLRTGWQFLTKHRDLLIFGLASYAIFIVLLVEVQFLLPIYVNEHLVEGADVYMSSEVYFALGSLFAGLVIRWFTRHLNQVKVIVGLMILSGLSFVVAAVFRDVVLFYLISVFIGFSNAGTRITRVTYLFNHIPNNIIGRANSLFYVYNISMRGLMLMLFSSVFFTMDNNIIWAYGISGAFILLSAIPLYMVTVRKKK